MECFLNDLQIADDECCGLYGADFWCDFPQEVREILLNMMFNMGRPRLGKFKKMNEALYKRDWKETAKEGRDSRWYRQVTNRHRKIDVKNGRGRRLMEFLLELATFWMWTVLIGIIIVAWAINKFDMREETTLTFSMKEMPKLEPVIIETKGLGFWHSMMKWFLTTRNWKVIDDWHYVVNGVEYVIPAGFQFDGASIPKFLRSFFSPVGIMLIGGLVHDYGYKYETLLMAGKKETIGKKDQKWMDQTFRDININVNGFYVFNQLSYYALRLAGFIVGTDIGKETHNLYKYRYGKDTQRFCPY